MLQGGSPGAEQETESAVGANLRMPRGVMQAPVTPFTDDYHVDYGTLEKLVNWHTETDRNIGIVALFNKAEPLSLAIEERKEIARVTIDVVAGRVPNLPVDEDGIDQLRAELDAIGVFGRARAGWSASQAARPAA